MPNPNDVLGPNGAIPVFNGGANWENLTTSINSQVKTGPGVLASLGINTGGTTSAVALYDGISSVVTLNIASPGVVNWPDHPFVAGGALKLTTTGALPTGLVADTTVFVSTAGLAAGSFRVADTRAHALAGTNTINFTGTQSGVQTGWDVSRPIGTYKTTVQDNIPIGAAVGDGIIAIATDGGGAADLSIFYV